MFTPIPVTLGCLRNGAFAVFGTYHTGEIITANWPVFTAATALAYQATEQVDVQAEILTCGTSYSTWGSVSYPMAAAHINDLNTILGMIT